MGKPQNTEYEVISLWCLYFLPNFLLVTFPHEDNRLRSPWLVCIFPGFTKMVISLWAITVLSLYIKVQVNILGRHMYIDTARGLGSSHLIVRPAVFAISYYCELSSSLSLLEYLHYSFYYLFGFIFWERSVVDDGAIFFFHFLHRSTDDVLFECPLDFIIDQMSF